MNPMTEQQAASGKRAAQGRATRGQLIEVATRLFAEHGYDGTSIEAVLSAAGVSRGALYHHFAGKEALFEAVVSAVSEQVTVELTETVKGCVDPLDAMRTAALAWIDLAPTRSSSGSCSSTRRPCLAGTGGGPWTTGARSAPCG